MRFLLDENVHVGVGKFLESKGHDVERILSGIKNGDVLKVAVRDSRILITHDKDFLDANRYPPKNYPGIACLRIHPPVLATITIALDRFLRELPEGGFSAVTISLGED